MPCEFALLANALLAPTLAPCLMLGVPQGKTVLASPVLANPSASQSVVQAVVQATPPSVNSGLRPPYHAVAGELEFTGELIVRPKQSLTRSLRARAMKMISSQVVRQYATTDEFILATHPTPEAPGVFENRRCSELLASGLFQYAHPNWLLFPVYTTNDPFADKQWHHTMMHSREAWDISSGSSDVIVAVTDTGINSHKDLTHRVGGYNAVTQLAEFEGGDLTDIHGHGTHVIGCAGASGDNGLGVAGTGWSLSIMPIRVSQEANGGAAFDTLLNGARWAIENGAKVTSASYSGIGYDAIETTGAYIHSIDGSLLWAAGNSSTNHEGWDFENVLVVGASDENDARAWFSSYGRGVDLFSPGVSILSTTNDGWYAWWSGTSMATPVANGALGVVRSANPALTAIHAEYILMHACDAWPGGTNSTEWGFGRINLQRAVEQALAADSPQPPVARADFANSFVGATFDLDVLSNDYDANMDALVFDWVASESSLGDTITVVPAGGAQPRDFLQFTAATSGVAGPRTFAYRLREPVSGATSEAIVTVTLQPMRAPANPIDETPGLQCRYWALDAPGNLPDWSAITPYLEEVVPTVNFASTDGNYANSGRADGVGAVYNGWLRVPTAGIWTLSITSDDGSRLSVGGEAVINNDGLHGMQTASAQLAFEAGMHAIQLEFFENGGGAGFVFDWSGPGMTTQFVAEEFLFHGGEVSRADINHDGRVDAADLSSLLAAWGTTDASSDVNQDGAVDASDLSMLLAAWGE